MKHSINKSSVKYHLSILVFSVEKPFISLLSGLASLLRVEGKEERYSGENIKREKWRNSWKGVDIYREK